MTQRKKKIIIIVTSIIVMMLSILIVFAILFFKTDIFKSNEELFAKYFMQNFNIIEKIGNKENVEIEDILNNSKYVSELEGNVEYTEDIGTTNQNKNNPINAVGIKINSNIDKINNYIYKNIAIGTDNNDLLKLEYIKQNQDYGIRLNGIKQFVSMDESQDNEIFENIEISNVEKSLSKIDINSILRFSEEETQTLINTYLKVIQSNVSKDKYYKQNNSLITVNGQDMKTNAYYIKFTIEEYNNLWIKILEQVIKDEIILSRIDFIEDEIKIRYSSYNENLREIFINNINNKIEEIKNNNIGSDEVRITVYENNQITVRTSIEKSIDKITIDLYRNSCIEVNCIKLGDVTEEEFFKLEKTSNSIILEYENVQDNEIINKLKFNYNELIENDKINKTLEVEIANKKYKSVFRIINNIQVVQEFEDEIILKDDNNIRLSDLQEEQLIRVKEILNQNIQEQINNFVLVVDLADYINMFNNLNIINTPSIQLPQETEITEIEKKRFNTQFEFFVSENLTNDNIRDLMEVVKSNLEDMKILLKSGEIKELDIEKLHSTEEGTEYRNNISEILLVIKRDSSNENKKEDVIKYLEDNSDNKYTVSIQYEDGLTRLVRVQIQDD